MTVLNDLKMVTTYDQNIDKQSSIMNKEIEIKTEFTAVMLNDMQMINKTQAMNKQIDMKHNIPMEDSHKFLVNTFMKNHRLIENSISKSQSITTTSINNMIEDLTPLISYADEPLLPLFKACVPLADIIYNISSYVQMALEETPEQPADGLTIDESAAIRLYTMEWEEPHRSLYLMLNHTLKQDNREILRPYFKYLKLLLTALVKLPCLPQLTVWRGVTKDLSAEFSPGTKVTWWSFSSCTKTLTVLENNVYLGQAGNRTLFSVEAINGRSIRDHSHFVNEDEILLLPGTHMIVQSQLSPATELHIIHLKQVVPKYVLLKPPFEGNFNNMHYLFKSYIVAMFRCLYLSTT